MVHQKFLNVSRSFGDTGGSFRRLSSEYESKLDVSPSWVTLGTMGGWIQLDLSRKKTEEAVRSTVLYF